MSFWNGREWVDEGPPDTDVRREGRAKHVAKAVLEAGLITALTFGLIAGSAFAAKPSGGGGGGGKHGGGGNTTGGSGTITLASPLVRDGNGNGTPNWGDVVRFNVSTSNAQPWVYLTCSQNGSVVSQGSEGYFAGALDDGDFGLYSPMWSGGAADCIAKLQTYSGSVLGSMSFHVDG